MPPVDIAELITRLEAASEGSRELDESIARDVLGWKRKFYDYGPGDGLVPPDWLHRDNPPFAVRAPKFTTSLDAALTLVQKGHFWAVRSAEVGGQRFGPRIRHETTAPLALCIAALRARAGSEK